MAYWIKITYERDICVIDLEQVTAFCHSLNRRLSFTLSSGQAIVVNPQNDPKAHQEILDFVEKRTGHSLRD